MVYTISIALANWYKDLAKNFSTNQSTKLELQVAVFPRSTLVTSVYLES